MDTDSDNKENDEHEDEIEDQLQLELGYINADDYEGDYGSDLYNEYFTDNNGEFDCFSIGRQGGGGSATDDLPLPPPLPLPQEQLIQSSNYSPFAPQILSSSLSSPSPLSSSLSSPLPLSSPSPTSSPTSSSFFAPYISQNVGVNRRSCSSAKPVNDRYDRNAQEWLCPPDAHFASKTVYKMICEIVALKGLSRKDLLKICDMFTNHFKVNLGLTRDEKRTKANLVKSFERNHDVLIAILMNENVQLSIMDIIIHSLNPSKPRCFHVYNKMQDKKQKMRLV